MDIDTCNMQHRLMSDPESNKGGKNVESANVNADKGSVIGVKYSTVRVRVLPARKPKRYI